jgi:hypothetical protein
VGTDSNPVCRNTCSTNLQKSLPRKKSHRQPPRKTRAQSPKHAHLVPPRVFKIPHPLCFQPPTPLLPPPPRGGAALFTLGGAPSASLRAGCPRSWAAGCRRAGRQPRSRPRCGGGAAPPRRGRGARTAFSASLPKMRFVELVHEFTQRRTRFEGTRRHQGDTRSIVTV